MSVYTVNSKITVSVKSKEMCCCFQVLSLYYARPAEKKSDCTFFDLTVKMEKDPESKFLHFPYTLRTNKTSTTLHFVLLLIITMLFLFIFSKTRRSH